MYSLLMCSLRVHVPECVCEGTGDWTQIPGLVASLYLLSHLVSPWASHWDPRLVHFVRLVLGEHQGSSCLCFLSAELTTACTNTPSLFICFHCGLVLGMESSSSCWYGKHFTDGVICTVVCASPLLPFPLSAASPLPYLPPPLLPPPLPPLLPFPPASNWFLSCSCFLPCQECSQRANNGRFTLRDLLMVPMQRVLKYHLLLQVPAQGGVPGCGWVLF